MKVPDAREIGAVIVSVVIVTGFVATVGVVLTRSLPAGNEAVAHELLGAMATLATMVATYWVGTSSGSAKKDKDLRAATAALAVSTPPPPVCEGDKS